MPGPPRQPEVDAPVDARLLRAEDLLVARIVAPGCTLRVGDDRDAGAGGPATVLVAGPDASLVVQLPPQHLGERAWDEEGGPAPTPTSAHRAAQPSRLVYELPEGTTIPFTLDGVLQAMLRLRLRVAGHAQPATAAVEGPAPAGPVIDVRHVLQLIVFGPDPVDGVADGEPGVETAAEAIRRRAREARLLHGLARDRIVLGGDGPTLRDQLGGDPQWIPFPPFLQGPRPPTDLETSIEAPYRLQVSPSVRGAFVHPIGPMRAPADAGRTEVWRTELLVRIEDAEGHFLGVTDDSEQRIVRAVWSRDLDELDADATADPDPLHPQSLLPRHRRAIVRESSDVRLAAPPRPIQVRRLALSSLGAWIDWAGAWVESEYLPLPEGEVAAVEQYRHQAVMGRDQYVRVTEPGFLFPFGHRAVWVTVSERKVRNRADAVAYLWQRHFIIVRQPLRTYDGHDSPWPQVVIEPLVTPSLDPVASLADPFVPARGGQPYEFTLVTTDRAGNPGTFAAPLVFVSLQALGRANPPLAQRIATVYSGNEQIAGRGQRVAFARPDSPGDTELAVNRLVFTADLQLAERTCRPRLIRTNAVVPAMRHLAPQSPGVDLAYAAPFLAADADGFGAANPGRLFLAVASPPAVDFSGGSDRSGGFLAPNLVVRALSRDLGAVGEDGSGPNGLSTGRFDPAAFLAGALPRLFGLFSLLDILGALGIGLDDAPSFVTESLDTVAAIVAEGQRLQRAAGDLGARLNGELAAAPHDGARAPLQAAIAQVNAATGPLSTRLQALLDAVAALPGAADPVAAVGAVTTALNDAAGAAGILLTAAAAPSIPAVVRAELERPAKALVALRAATDTVAALEAFARDLLSPGTAVTARFEWRPVIHSWPSPPADPVLLARNPRGLRLAVEVRAAAAGPPHVDVAAEFADFGLQLLPGAPLMAMTFSRIGFRVTSGGKPEVDVVFDGIEFLGALSFVDTLRRMIPFDGFADPPYVDVSPEGVTAGFDLALPNLAVGVFSLENISLGADARVPFLGDAVTVGFHFCSKESPFRLTVMCVGGGGWVELRASPKGLVLLEVGLEAVACLSVDLGVASGSVSVSVGVYLRLEADKGLLTAYFRIRGEVDVLGLISASITLELSLTYHFESGKLIGRASLVVEVEVLFFSASVEISVERKLAGSKGDPVLRDILPPGADGTNDDWSSYCAAFA